MIERVLRYAGLLRETAFRRLWVAQSISQVGTQVTQLALPLVAILVLGASPFEVALLGAVEFLPFLLFALPAGVWVDRLERRRVLVGADLGRAAILALLPLAAIASALSIWLLYAVAFGVGVLTVFFDVGYQAILPDLVTRDRLQEGNSRLEVSRSAAVVIGPGLGGVLVGVLTAPIAIVVDAVSYLGSAAFLIGLRPRSTRMEPGRSTTARTSLRIEILEGLRFYRGSRLLLASSAAIVTSNVGGTLAGAIYLVYLVRELVLTPELIGIALSTGSVGLLVGATMGSAVGKRFGVGRTLALGFGLSNAAAFAMVIATPATAFGLMVASGLLQGFGVILVQINGVSLRQALTPDHLQGRVNATGRWINWSVIPIASIAGGVIATIIGLRGTVAIGAIIGLFALPWILFSPLGALRAMPNPHAARPPAG